MSQLVESQRDGHSAAYGSPPTMLGRWAARGLCRDEDPELWFPKKGESATKAKAICRRCPVRAQCLTTAMMLHDVNGVWGGYSAKERERLRRMIA